jgi:hypothetical protein
MKHGVNNINLIGMRGVRDESKILDFERYRASPRLNYQRRKFAVEII